jgi:hypothetical protein
MTSFARGLPLSYPACENLGGVPLMLGAGTGSELRRPLGYAIVGDSHCRKYDAVHDAGRLPLSRSTARSAKAACGGSRLGTCARRPPSLQELALCG